MTGIVDDMVKEIRTKYLANADLEFTIVFDEVFGKWWPMNRDAILEDLWCRFDSTVIDQSDIDMHNNTFGENMRDLCSGAIEHLCNQDRKIIREFKKRDR